MRGDQPIGSGFLLAVPEGNLNFVYLVTAKHVMEAAIHPGEYTFRLRVNTKNDDAAQIVDFPIVPLQGLPWLEDSDQAVDLAICILANPDDLMVKYDVDPIQISEASRG